MPLSCDDDTFPEDSALYRWSVLMNEAFRGNGGRSLDTALQYERQLAEAGFVDIQVVREKWPSNRWPREKKYKQIGIWNQENMIAGLAGYSLALMTRPKEEGGLGWAREAVEVLLAGVRKDMRDTNIHSYYPL
ncbi:hypothetical protein IMZ48_36955 [Candidatus Bathyarchaeota archaeon]|nr:hypothetical protein [Candidatus Bathyarchaeota archaeon]